MRPPLRSGPTFRLRAALWFTTVPVPAEGRGATGNAAGWRVRIAAPKWACVWRDHPEAQRRLRAIVMPRPWNGWFDPVWQALLQKRLHDFGLDAHEPESRLLMQAEREVLARLAPPWTKIIARPYG